MAKTQDIKRRIRSIRNTMQLTRAMKMVSAAKLRRAQERMLGARPYAERTVKILRSLSARADTEGSPLLQSHGHKRVELLLVSGDKGLCGSFNSGVIRRAEELEVEFEGREITFATVGKKGREYFVRRNRNVPRQWADVFRHVEFAKAVEIAAEMVKLYNSKEVDEIYLVYSEFKSAIEAIPKVHRLLPVEPAEFGEGEQPDEYLYEPNAAELMDRLLPHYVEQTVFQALLESAAAEHAARMTAMESATNNASDLIDSLTLTMNRVRQAAITTEIIEVVSGAEALS